MKKKYTKDEILSIAASLFHVVDLPEENRTGVMRIVNPVDWFAIRFDLDEYEGQTVTVKFSAEVMRVGASGTLRWQINNSNYPAVGRAVSGANTDVWHKFSGEWTGKLTGSPPVIYLSTWRNDSERTTFYIDNVSLEVTVKAIKS
jgi:hypothetical protein